jgi:uncharacterized protein
MDHRIVEFISALRAAGVRVSLAESADAMRAIDAVGVLDRATFKSALRATLIKEPADVASFDQQFPLYFSSEGPELQPPQGLSKEQQEQLERAIDALKQQIREMMRQLAEGERLSQEQLEQAAQQAGMRPGMRGSPHLQEWVTQRMERQLGLTPEQVRDALEALLKQLKDQGMNGTGRQEVRETVQQNADAMREQLARFVGKSLLNQPNENPRRQRVDDLMDEPLSSLSEAEADELRNHVRRLVARLRSRAALRMRRGNRKNIDVKGTIRYNQRFMGVPLEIKHRKRALKPKITIIVDVSTSMRPVAEFMLRMVYELQDQISKARTFAFISDLHDMSMVFEEFRPAEAVERVLTSLPPGHYNTDLGVSINTLLHEHGDAVDRRTILIFVGDARNNYNDPRIDLMQQLKARAKRLVWFNPEPPMMWGHGDSDMLQYAPVSTAVHQVATLTQLADAIDDLFQAR